MALISKKLAAPLGGILLAGLAAFAYYKYSRMSPEQKDSLVGDLKERGRKLLGQVKKKQNGQLAEATPQYTG